jgi:hypothetical protein
LNPGAFVHLGAVFHPDAKESVMTVCPIAIVAGCQKCPAFGFCPLKTVLGDQTAQATPDKDKPAASDQK